MGGGDAAQRKVGAERRGGRRWSGSARAIGGVLGGCAVIAVGFFAARLRKRLNAKDAPVKAEVAAQGVIASAKPVQLPNDGHVEMAAAGGVQADAEGRGV